MKKSLLALSVLSTLMISSTSFGAYGLPEQIPAPVEHNWYFGVNVGPSYTPSPDDLFGVNIPAGLATVSVPGFFPVSDFSPSVSFLRRPHYDNPGVNAGAHIGYRFGHLR